MAPGDSWGGDARGFAGLLSLVSHVPDQPRVERPPPPPKTTTEQSDTVTSGATRPTPVEPAVGSSPPPTPWKQPQSKSGWGWIAAAVGGLIVILGIVNNSNNTYSPRTPSPVATQRYEAPPKPSPPPVASSARTEDMPYPGDGSRSLTQGNIRWCLFQDRRLEIMRRAAQDPDTRQFNILVEDFNDRCGRFRYRESDMAVVRAELPLREADLQRQAERIMCISMHLT